MSGPLNLVMKECSSLLTDVLIFIDFIIACFESLLIFAVDHCYFESVLDIEIITSNLG